jgi:hypothetical protein
MMCVIVLALAEIVDPCRSGYNAGMSLPLPDSDALAASHALQQDIAAAIQQAGGAIPFSRFMELALYAPRLGYYSGGAAPAAILRPRPRSRPCSGKRWRARQPLLSPKARPTSSNSAPAPASWRATS